MAPHSLSDMSSPTQSYTSTTITSPDDISSMVNGSRGSNLHRYGDDEVQDLVCCGFGPASLAIAVALHDSLEMNDTRLATRAPRARFLEKQHKFAWHAGMLLPGAKMQITFLKDMATLRNPQSEFTFLNYLHAKDRLVAFTNLNTFLPQRVEYEDYMRWCAEHFNNVVDYSQNVESVTAGPRSSRTGAVEYFNVHSTNSQTGERQSLKAKNVVIAAGGRPNIPQTLPEYHPRIIHSSQYATHINKIFPEGSHPKRIAVIGAGQSAAECWHDIPMRFPGTQSVMLMRGAAMKPSDDSPFVNEVFNPERVDDVFAQDPKIRANALALDKATNYGVVRIELLEQIYGEMYSYQIQNLPEEEWPLRIMNYREVNGMRDITVDGKPAIELQIQNNAGLYHQDKDVRAETVEVDLVVVASGYRRDAHKEMLHEVRDLMPGGNVGDKDWTVKRDYAVEFAEGAVEPDAGVWLQGCNEKTHGLSDTLLSILAVRGGEMVENIFGYSPVANEKHMETSFELR
ncbi:putative L-lysine 6-monooxygenase/L-ornithine 5-monooxygenase, FAD/NAD(P)-binding domain superfamily [Septoria linicola]|nr:putative L-lysine 6-monooxygenase/L-ornithine 5-monooxygenase, FAD/NAD(P)-binding domain superfamily [Septoria linicola]